MLAQCKPEQTDTCCAGRQHLDDVARRLPAVNMLFNPHYPHTSFWSPSRKLSHVTERKLNKASVSGSSSAGSNPRRPRPGIAALSCWKSFALNQLGFWPPEPSADTRQTSRPETTSVHEMWRHATRSRRGRVGPRCSVRTGRREDKDRKWTRCFWRLK